jgi:hypothetical protein
MIPVIRMGFQICINYNEGWNLYHTLTAMSGQALYSGKNELTPVNYPPLSFYIVGGLGKVLEPLRAGRYVSLISVLLLSAGVGYAVLKLGGKIYHGVFAGVFCLGLFLIYAIEYVGMNDPQMLAHVFVLGGLLIYLNNSYRNRDLFFVAFLMVVGLFIKHNLLALPLAITIDLFFKSRHFVRWIGYLTIIAVSFTAITLVLGGTNFINELVIGRSYDIERMYVWVRTFGRKSLLALIITLPWVIYAFKKDNFRIIPLYLLTALVVNFAASGGYGTNINMFFDLFIAISIIVGMMLAYIQINLKNRFKYYNYLLLGTAVFYCLIIVSGVPKIIDSYRVGSLVSELQLKEQSFIADTAYLANKPEPVLCEEIALCYYAKKRFEYDPFLTAQMAVTKKIDEKILLKKIEDRYFTTLQLYKELPKKYSQNLPYTSSPILSLKNERFTENMMQAIANHYTLERKSEIGVFYIPKDKS